jgi:GNAT superfamily N-acetyltransferase
MATAATTPATSIVIRELRTEDYTVWRELWTAYLTFYKTTLPDEVYTTTFHRLLDAKEPTFGALAWADGDVPVGLVHWIYHRTCWSASNTCYLQDLFTKADRRAAGVGRRLIQHVHEDAQRRGSARVYWNTHETNAVARRLYDRVAERSGFIQYVVTTQSPQANLKSRI